MLDCTAAGMLQALLEAKESRFLLERETAELIKGEAGSRFTVRPNDGAQLPAEFLIVAADLRA
jgi:nitrite reductase (NADH) large subunit